MRCPDDYGTDALSCGSAYLALLPYPGDAKAVVRARIRRIVIQVEVEHAAIRDRVPRAGVADVAAALCRLLAATPSIL